MADSIPVKANVQLYNPQTQTYKPFPTKFKVVPAKRRSDSVRIPEGFLLRSQTEGETPLAELNFGTEGRKPLEIRVLGTQVTQEATGESFGLHLHPHSRELFVTYQKGSYLGQNLDKQA